MALHIWNTSALAIALARKQVSSDEKFQYFVMGNALAVGAAYLGSLFITTPEGWLFWYEALLVVVVTVFGCIRCRDKYQAATDDRLLENVIMLGLPLTLKVNLGSWLAYVGIGWGLHWLIPHLSITSDSAVSFSLIAFVLNAVIKFHPFLIAATGTFIWYWRMGVHLETVAAGPKPELALQREVLH